MRKDAPHTPNRALKVPSGRLSRLARMGRMTTGIAGRSLFNAAKELGQGHRPDLRGSVLTPANIKRLTEELAHMRGAAMKMGQLLSMDTGEFLPPELSDILARLRDNAHFMPPQQLKQVLTAAWGPDWQRQFARFDPRPIAAASIGQVHKAALKDGQELAIKVQYPGVVDSIDSDIANVGALIRLSGLLPKGFDLAPILADAKMQLHEETDYVLEAGHLRAFQSKLGGDPAFSLPQVIPELSSKNTLAMTFMPGHPVEEAASLDQDTRNGIARDLIDLLLREVFVFGLVQSDPNFANYRFDPATGKIILLDFGATRAVDPELAGQYADILQSGLAHDWTALEQAARAIGLITGEEDPTHRAKILDMMQAVFLAITDAPTFDFADLTLSQDLQSQGMALAQSGYVPPPVPMDVLYLQRKFGGIFLLANRLGAAVPLAEMLHDALAQMDPLDQNGRQGARQS